MSNQSTRIFGLFVFLVAATVPSTGYSDGWTWGPFSKSEASRDSSPLYSKANRSKSSWLPTMKWPKAPWSNNGLRTTSYSRSNTSTWGKVSKTSKRWFNKTAEILDPYPDPKPSTYTNNSDSKKSKPGFFSGWFQSKEPDGPTTVNGFFAQEKLN